MLRGQEVAALEIATLYIGETREEVEADQRAISVEVDCGPVDPGLPAVT